MAFESINSMITYDPAAPAVGCPICLYRLSVIYLFQMVNIYKCPSCEGKINYGCNYCQHCGAKLEWEDDDSAVEDLSELSEDELVVTHMGRNTYIPDSNSSRVSAKVAGGIAGLAFWDLMRGTHNLLYSDCSEIKLCHSKSRLYGITPDKKHEVIDVALSDISIDYIYEPVYGSDFGSFIIKIPNKRKRYIRILMSICLIGFINL